MVLIICSACGTGSGREVKQLRNELVALHDEVMPLMSPLYKMRRQLQKMEADSSNIELRAVIVEISEAEESMMDWMRNYDPDFQGTENETVRYLSDKKLAIEQVNVRMRESLIMGEEQLQKGSNGLTDK